MTEEKNITVGHVKALFMRSIEAPRPCLPGIPSLTRHVHKHPHGHLCTKNDSFPWSQHFIVDSLRNGFSISHLKVCFVVLKLFKISIMNRPLRYP